MLNRSERARLAELERQLEREDPDLARQFMIVAAPRQPRRWARVLLVVGIVGVVLGVVVASSPVLFFVGVVPLLAWWLLTRRARRRDPRDPG